MHYRETAQPVGRSEIYKRADPAHLIVLRVANRNSFRVYVLVAWSIIMQLIVPGIVSGTKFFWAISRAKTPL